nr:MFS transporter [Metallosphaera tengchongensis]
MLNIYMQIPDKVDKVAWSRTHSLLLASLALGFFMWGTISTIAPLLYPSVNYLFFILAPIIATLTGNIVFPLLSDRIYGRKKTFMITMGMYGIGSLMIASLAVFSQLTGTPLTYTPVLYLLTIGIVLGVLGVEGEVPVMLSYAAEMMPLRRRDQVLVLAPNFDNVGAMVASAVVLVTSAVADSAVIDLLALSITALVGLAFLIIVRLKLPESVRWLLEKGRVENAEKEVTKLGNKIQELNENKSVRPLNLLSRYWFLVAIAISQYLTYGLMAFYIGDFYFPNLENLIVFVANVGASVAGFIAAMAINKIKSRKFSLFSFMGGTITILGILATINIISKNMELFYGLLMLNMAFSEFGWAVRTIYEPLILPTRNRAFLIGLVRVFPITLSTVSVYFASFLNSPFDYVLYNTVLWALGAIASLTWFFKGFDVNMTPIEFSSGTIAEKGTT